MKTALALFASHREDPAVAEAAARATAPLGAGDVLLCDLGARGVLTTARRSAVARGATVVEYGPGEARLINGVRDPRGWNLDPLPPGVPQALLAGLRRASDAGWAPRVVACDTGARVALRITGGDKLFPVETPPLAAPPPREGITTYDGLVAASQSFAPHDLLFVDCECTGRSATTHGLVEIAAVRTDPTGRVVRAEWESRVFPHPGHLIDPDAVALCGYDEELWERTARPIEDALDELDILLLHRPVFAGHNPAFDKRFITAAYARARRAMPPLHPRDVNTVVQANKLKARGLIPNAKLETVAKHLGLDVSDSHRALPDTRRSREVFVRLVSAELST